MRELQGRCIVVNERTFKSAAKLLREAHYVMITYWLLLPLAGAIFADTMCATAASEANGLHYDVFQQGAKALLPFVAVTSVVERSEIKTAASTAPAAVTCREKLLQSCAQSANLRNHLEQQCLQMSLSHDLLLSFQVTHVHFQAQSLSRCDANLFMHPPLRTHADIKTCCAGHHPSPVKPAPYNKATSAAETMATSKPFNARTGSSSAHVSPLPFHPMHCLPCPEHGLLPWTGTSREGTSMDLHLQHIDCLMP